MSNKTISINPSLFKIGNVKTKKRKEKIIKPKMVPLISPSVLKNKLLKRIKEHKQKEILNSDNKNKLNKNIDVVTKDNDDNFSDEFTDSINYLQTLSKQRNIIEEKKRSEIIKQKQREELERKTVKNYNSLSKSNNLESPIINIDLPEELIEPVTQINQEPFKINVKEDVPYGILKGGIKPSYKEWSKTQKNTIVTNPNGSLIIEGNNISSRQSARENRLNLLKQKIKNKQDKDPLITENLIRPTNNIEKFTEELREHFIDKNDETHIDSTVKKTDMNVNENNGKVIATKYITTKTIKRKYTLGRSKIKKSVSVLIKDRGTRKKILTAQKNLKRKNVNDIKTYLREHNLIKIGSNAPNDVLRKIYETAMLTGEITNSNSEILLHNFSKEDKEL